MSEDIQERNVYEAPEANVVAELEAYDEKSLLSPQGRLSRLGYLGAGLLISVVTVLLVAGATAMIESFAAGNANALTGVTMIIYVFSIVCSIILALKRIHDFNRTGWWLLSLFIPLVNFLPILALMFIPGTTGPNKYGPPPKPRSTLISVFAALMVFVATMGILAAIALPAYQDYRERLQEQAESSETNP